MSIETSAKPVAAKAADATDSRVRKAAGQTAAGPAHGFMAILSAMDESAVAATGLACQDEAQKVAIAPVDSAQVATNLIAISNPDPAMIPLLPALDLALQGPFTEPGSTLRPDNTPVAPEGAIASEAGLAAAAALVQTPGGPGPASPAPVPAATTAKVAGGNDVPAGDFLQDQATGRAGETTGVKAKAFARVEQGAGRAVPDSTRIQEARLMATLEAMRGVQDRSPVEPAQAASPMAALIGEKPTAERGRFQERAPEGGGFGVQPFSLGTTSYASPAVQDGGAVSPEMAVAQEVSYWISQDIQNAELKLDGLGLEAVEVSISMHGNEAHVAFRTDELQARTMLEGAAAHLKEALQGEGLVLSGVSVGTSGARDSGDNERKQRQGTRQTASMPVSIERLEAGRPRSGTAGRTLDLFV